MWEEGRERDDGRGRKEGRGREEGRGRQNAYRPLHAGATGARSLARLLAHGGTAEGGKKSMYVFAEVCRAFWPFFLYFFYIRIFG